MVSRVITSIPAHDLPLRGELDGADAGSICLSHFHHDTPRHYRDSRGVPSYGDRIRSAARKTKDTMTTLTYSILDAAPTSLNKTSVLVTGETEALVVDAAFTRADGHRIVAEVLDSGKTLTHRRHQRRRPGLLLRRRGHRRRLPGGALPGPGRRHRAHPRQLRGQAQGVGAPRRQPADPAGRDRRLTGTTLTVDGTTIEVRRGSDLLGDRSWYLFEPATRSLFGGVLLFEGLHVWTADSATTALRARVDPRAGRPRGARPGVRRRGPPREPVAPPT